MKNKLYIYCVLGLMLGLMSCNNFLNEDPKGRLSAHTFFTSQDELNMAVTALWGKVNAAQTNTVPCGPNWQGDDLTTHPSSNKQAYAQFDRFAPVNDNKIVMASWDVWYTVIKSANYIIMNAEKTPVSKSEIQIALGQAHYWRAYAYFHLVRVFGKIPMNLDNKVSQDRPLAGEREVYDQVITDLNYCIANLPTSYSSMPRQYGGVACYITKQAALATISCVYMNMAGWPLKLGQPYYEKAAAAAKEVIDGCKKGIYEYELLPNYRQVYSLSQNYNRETVVGINYNQAFKWSQDTQMGKSNIFESQGGWGDGWGTYSFWKEFPEGPRKDATFMPKIMVLVGTHKGNLHNFWDTDEKGNYIIAEAHPAYQIFCASNNGTADFDYTYGRSTSPKIDASTTSQRHHLIRYSEVLLWYAECSARATGSINADALECLNRVRTRAGLPVVGPSDYTPKQFADFCVKEHGWEVAGYWVACQTRRMDQQRMELFAAAWAQRQKDHTVGVEIAPGVVLKEALAPVGTFSESKIYAPYPSTDVNLNPNLKR